MNKSNHEVEISWLVHNTLNFCGNTLEAVKDYCAENNLDWEDFKDVRFQAIQDFYYDQLEQKRLQVTEEWIEEKVLELFVVFNILRPSLNDENNAKNFIRLLYLEAGGQLEGYSIDSMKNIIRLLVEEMPAKKATVSEEFVEKWYSTIMELASGDYPELGSDDLEEMLTEAGVEVVK